MKAFQQILCSFVCLGLGYGLGINHVLEPTDLKAVNQESDLQITIPEGMSETTFQLVKTSLEATNSAMSGLEQDRRYNPVVKGMNAFATSVGGVDAAGDLEKGYVDPETFAALYADRASDQIRKELGKDEQGRLTYKKKVIRMYSIKRLKELFSLRERMPEIGQ